MQAWLSLITVVLIFLHEVEGTTDLEESLVKAGRLGLSFGYAPC